MNVQLDSVPPGAEARTSLGPSCKTPCSVPVTAEGNFSVTYTLNKFQPVTVPVQIVNNPGEFAGESLIPGSIMVDPNPVVAELKPAGPVPKAVRAKSTRPKTAKPPKSAAAPAAGSPFPAPPPR